MDAGNTTVPYKRARPHPALGFGLDLAWGRFSRTGSEPYGQTYYVEHE